MLYSEAEIVHELKAGNEICLNMLFDNYYRALCVYAFRFVSDMDDVEDIVQEVFVSFWINKKQTAFTGSIRSYLFGAVSKAAFKFASRNRRKRFDDVEKYVDSFWEELSDYDDSEFIQLRDKVNARVEALPDRTKEIFKAVVLDSMTYQQVGERFGVTVNTVKTMYYRALKQLKEEFGGDALILFFIFRK